jgi:enoyl-CoA hydratase
MGNEVVVYEKEDRIGLITINRPEVKNSLNIAVFHTLNDIINLVAKDEEIRAVVITGAGTAFVAGADINELLAHDTLNGWSASRFSQSVFNKIERLEKPSIAAINGVALGGGFELALACTMLLLFSTIINAEEAYRIGLVNHVVEQDQVLNKTKDMAKSLSALSPVAVRLTMELLRYGQNEGFDTGLALESALASLTVSSNEAKDLLGRFLSRGKGIGGSAGK